MLLASLVALAQTAASPAVPAAEPGAYSGRQGRLHVAVPRIEAEIHVDGVLDEAAWGQAARLTEFSASLLDGEAQSATTWT